MTDENIKGKINIRLKKEGHFNDANDFPIYSYNTSWHAQQPFLLERVLYSIPWIFSFLSFFFFFNYSRFSYNELWRGGTKQFDLCYEPGIPELD